MASYDARTALLAVDVQNDFADPAGALYVPGGEQVVPVVNEEVAAASAAGALIVYTQDWHPPSTPHFQKDGGPWPVHCVHGTWGAELHPGLRVIGDAFLRKGSGGEDGYSAFSVRDPRSGETAPTALESTLRERAVERIVVAGLATDYCVVQTVLDASRLSFSSAVVTAGIRAVDLQPGDGARALDEMGRAGAELV